MGRVSGMRAASTKTPSAPRVLTIVAIGADRRDLSLPGPTTGGNPGKEGLA